MSFLKNLMTGVILFSFISTGFILLINDLNTNYSSSYELDGGNQAYLNKIDNLTSRVDFLTSEMNSSMSAQSISTGEIGTFEKFILGGKIAAGIFSTIINLPGLIFETIALSVGILNIPNWVVGFISLIVWVSIIFSIGAFLMGRRIGDVG